MDEEQKPEPKISLPEGLFVLSFVVLVDIIDLIGLAFGLPLSDVTDIVAFPVTQLYTYLKGLKGIYMLIGNLIEAIPWIGDLPVRTVTFCITWWLDHHPKIEAAAALASTVYAGKGPAFEGAGEGEAARAAGAKAGGAAAEAGAGAVPEAVGAPEAAAPGAEAAPKGVVAPGTEAPAPEAPSTPEGAPPEKVPPEKAPVKAPEEELGEAEEPWEKVKEVMEEMPQPEEKEGEEEEEEGGDGDETKGKML